MSGRSTRGEGGAAKAELNPMGLVALMNAAPRCTATAKHSRQRCKGPAVKGWTVCRCHGARGGAPKGERNGRWTGGQWSGETLAMRREFRELVKACRETLATISD